ncbi:MAG: glucose-6-phosphate isomerase [Candidatus Omnitrophota bacterium]|jgi:glucose-6-phosphate isomerase
MEQIKFDFNNMFSFSVGEKHGVTEAELVEFLPKARDAHEHLNKVLQDTKSRVKFGLEWVKLPYQEVKAINQIQNLGKEISAKFQNVIFLGIGGSYLGLKAGQDALGLPYANEFPGKKSPKIYFEGNNLDPDTLSVLIKNLNPKKSFVVVISKSGETTETKAAFAVVEAWLKKSVGKKYGRQIIAITDSERGSLRKKVDAEQKKDSLSFRSFPLLKGVGGRYSEFNMGLLHLALIGVDIQEVLKGAADMHRLCSKADILNNPAYMYAVLHTILYKKKNKPLAILMPFSETLKSSADWYIQLLAESLGKKFARRIEFQDGQEQWLRDQNNIINTGRTPISARGTGDLHSIQQNSIEGENNKVTTFIRVEKFRKECKVPAKAGILSGKTFSALMRLAQEATEWALVREERPNCTIILPEVSPYYWGGLLFFFEMATAFEGELLNVNAFDQPGVEGYKNYIYYKLGKPGLAPEVAAEIKSTPLIKNPKYIL